MRSFGQQKRTAADKRTTMIQFLYGCRPVVLKTVTVDDLVNRHGIARKEAEHELVFAKQKRAAEL
jgi:hypothetical protein